MRDSSQTTPIEKTERLPPPINTAANENGAEPLYVSILSETLAKRTTDKDSLAATCDPSNLRMSDLPREWTQVDHELCGISWPADRPTNLSDCCVGELKISNGCFQYCEPALDRTFAHCTFGAIGDVTSGGSTCKGVRRSGARRTGVEGGLVGSVVMLWLLMKLMRWLGSQPVGLRATSRGIL